MDRFDFDAQTHQLKSRTFVQRARYEPVAAAVGETSNWLFEKGWSRDFNPAAQVSSFATFDQRTAPLEPADYFVTEARQPELMPQLQDRFAQLTFLFLSGNVLPGQDACPETLLRRVVPELAPGRESAALTDYQAARAILRPGV